MSKRRIRKTRHLINRLEAGATTDSRATDILAIRKDRIARRQALVTLLAVPPGER